MKQNTSIILLVVAFAAASVFGLGTAVAQKPESDELQRTYQLAPGASVDVSNISGSVEIQTSNTNVAEVHVIRTARKRSDLAYRNVLVEQRANGLVVHGESEREGVVPRSVEVNHRVVLKIPRRVDLTVNSISGPVTVGDIDGSLQVDQISGSVHLGDVRGPLAANSISGPLTAGKVGDQVRFTNISGNVTLGGSVGHLELRDVSGNVSANMERLDNRGIQVRNVSGAIELRFADALNADVTATGIDGDVLLDVPNVSRESTLNRTTVRARVGTGGRPISITEVSGTVRLMRAG